MPIARGVSSNVGEGIQTELWSRSRRPDVAQADFGGVAVERAEPVQADPGDRHRRAKMQQLAHQAGNLAILLRGLAGEPVDDVPVRDDAALLEPLERLDIAESRGPLAHAAQDTRDQALDAGLQGPATNAGQLRDLRLVEVHLRLVEH